ISGNPLSVANGVSLDVPATSSGSLTLALAGSGGLVKTGGGTLVLSAANTYTGVTAINAGTLQIRTDTALGAIGAGHESTVADGGSLALNGPNLTVAEPIFFTGRGAAGTSGAIAAVGGPNTLSGQLTLKGDAVIDGSPNAELVIATGIGESGGRETWVSAMSAPSSRTRPSTPTTESRRSASTTRPATTTGAWSRCTAATLPAWRSTTAPVWRAAGPSAR